MIVYFYTLIRMFRLYKILENLKRNYGKIIIMKNYEVQKLQHEFDDDEEQTAVKKDRRKL